MATTKELTELVEKQALMIELLVQRIESLELSREGMRGWAEKVQAHLTHKPAKKQSDWVSGPRPSHPVRRPVAPAAAAAEIEPEQAPPCEEACATVPDYDLPF